MKRISFLNLNDNTYGGVNSVNHTLMTFLAKKGYKTDAVFLRALNEKGLGTPPGAQYFLARNAPWHFTQFCEIKTNIKDKKYILALKNVFTRISDTFKLFSDRRKIRKYLKKANPDRIIVSHYLLLDAVPKKMLRNTYMHIHTSFEATKSVKKGYSVLKKYNKKINFIFLSERISAKAQNEGFENTFYLYNPIKFEIPEMAEKENKIAVITRLSPEKRIPEMAENVALVLKDFPEWSFEIYGSGEEEEKIAQVLKKTGCGKLCGVTFSPEKVLASASLTLNTSEYEGFSLSIIESYALGVPVVAFDFGEASKEEIINGQTGIIVPNNDFEKFRSELHSILEDKPKLEKMSRNAKEFSRRFLPEQIICDLEEILK